MSQHWPRHLWTHHCLSVGKPVTRRRARLNNEGRGWLLWALFGVGVPEQIAVVDSCSEGRHHYWLEVLLLGLLLSLEEFLGLGRKLLLGGRLILVKAAADDLWQGTSSIGLDPPVHLGLLVLVVDGRGVVSEDVVLVGDLRLGPDLHLSLLGLLEGGFLSLKLLLLGLLLLVKPLVVFVDLLKAVGDSPRAARLGDGLLRRVIVADDELLGDSGLGSLLGGADSSERRYLSLLLRLLSHHLVGFLDGRGTRDSRDDAADGRERAHGAVARLLSVNMRVVVLDLGERRLRLSLLNRLCRLCLRMVEGVHRRRNIGKGALMLLLRELLAG